MLDAAGGGGAATRWESMTVDQMHNLIQGASTDGQWNIVTGWKESAELISAHRTQLEQFRDYLADAWPPDKSTASEAYRDRLNVMIDNIIATHDAALANYDALAGATGAIYQAQVRMEQIHQEYQNNQTLLDAYNAKQQEAQSSGRPQPSPSPSGGDQPPVAAGRQAALQNEAIVMLSGVSTELAQAQSRIVTPPPYKIFEGADETKAIGSESSYVAPPIPPLVSVAANDTSYASSSRPSTTFPTSSVTSPVTVQPGITSPQPGLVLGGTGTPTPPTVTPPSSFNPLTPTGGGGPITNPTLLPPSTFTPGGGPSPVPPTGIGGGRNLGLPRQGILRSGGPLPEGMRAMPPGGVIGGPPNAGLGRTAAGRASASRVNPVGGVIGEGRGGVAGARRGVAGMAGGEHPGGMYGQGGNRRPGQWDEADGTHWDPDDPWDTAEGVAPVVLPAAEQRVDPGPAIGLS
jgi:hypothetical protein